MAMTGQQRTFELVPTTLVKQTVSRPPMTSKAAKKAYQAAQKGPRISKAEQRRRDAAEFERIRKEHEKERNAAKAKASREKKAAKALAEKEARRKAGLPEPSRFVHASQPTISKFVRAGSNGKRSWQQMEDVGEETEDISDDDDDTGLESKNKAQRPAKRITLDTDADGDSDEFGEFPALSQSALEKIESSAASLVEGMSAPPSPEKKQNLGSVPCSPDATHQLRSRKTNEDKPSFEEKAATHLLSKAAEAASRSYALEPSALPPPAPILEPLKNANKELSATPLNLNQCEDKVSDLRKQPERNQTPLSNSRPALQERSSNMPPPRLPFKKPPISFSTPALKPQDPRQKTNRFPARAIHSLPPSSTQAFLEDHLDDFFPSPSQQVRELLDEIDDIPSNTQIAKELGPEKTTVDDHFDDLICTQDLVLTPQDLEEIITPSRAPAKPINKPMPRSRVPPPGLSASRNRPRFFEEKAEDLHRASVHEHKISQNRGPGKQSSNTASAASINGNQSNPRPRRFFEEKEEDILQAVLHESKMSAPKQVKTAPSKAPLALRKEHSVTDYGDCDFGGFFEDEEQKMVQAAIEESKRMAGPETQQVPLKDDPPPQKTKRTLKRVQSGATDYGDDEFSGCSQELLALC